MKLSSKSMSSPGRAEKYPPPLMRFMSSNGGSRSRRSRSSPMFVRKKNAAVQEPSSPKVTCMGQVRVRRSKQSNTRRGMHKNRCKWIHNALFCRQMSKKLKVKSFGSIWRKWVLFFPVSFKKKSKNREDPLKIEPKNGYKNQEMEQKSDEDDEAQEDAKVYVSSALTPPKNALLLTRCRSAPYRSSSLHCRFWGSPLDGEEAEQKQSTEHDSRQEEEDEGRSTPPSKRESVSEESYRETSLDQAREEKLGFIEELEGSITSIKERILKPEFVEALRSENGTVRPLTLKRCKSEPARTGDKLDPDMSYWRKRRLGLT